MNFVCLILVMIIYFCIEKKYTNPFEPNHLFFWYWFINIIIGVIWLNFTFEWNFIGFIFIFFQISFFSIAFNIGKKIRIKKGEEIKKNEISRKKSNRIIFLGTLILFLYDIIELKSGGFSIQDVFYNILKVSYFFTDSRYGDSTVEVSFIGQILLSIGYATFIFAGYAYEQKKINIKSLLLILLPAVFEMLFSSSKTMVVSGILLFITGYLVSNSISRNKLNINFKVIFKIAIIVIIVFIAIYFSFYYRYGKNSEGIYNRIIIYNIGHIPCFDNWFENYPKTLFGTDYGYNSFRTIYKMLHIVPNNLSTFDSRIDTIYGWTNVRTMFSDYIMDFGVLGSCLMQLLIGFFGRNII